MKAAQDTLHRKGLVILYEGRWKLGFREGRGVENLSKPAPAVAKTPWLKEFHIVQRSLENLHPTSLADAGRDDGAILGIAYPVPLANLDCIKRQIRD